MGKNGDPARRWDRIRFSAILQVRFTPSTLKQLLGEKRRAVLVEAWGGTETKAGDSSKNSRSRGHESSAGKHFVVVNAPIPSQPPYLASTEREKTMANLPG